MATRKYFNRVGIVIFSFIGNNKYNNFKKMSSNGEKKKKFYLKLQKRES